MRQRRVARVVAKMQAPAPIDAGNQLAIPSALQHVKIQQMQRDGKPFVKADLVAIAAALTNEKAEVNMLYAYQNMTCEDLRSAIREHIYFRRTAGDDPGLGGALAIDN